MSAQPPSSSAITNSHPIRGLVFACLGCGTWVALWWMMAASREQIPQPFAWWDIALVSTTCWIPVGLVCSGNLLRLSRWLPGLLGAVGLIFSSAILAGSSSSSLEINPYLSRLVWGAFVGISVTVLVQSLNRPSESKPAPIWSLSSLVLLAPLIAIVTSAYTANRIRYHEKKIGDYLSQYRLMDAHELIARLQILEPSRTINKKPLFMVADDLDQELNSIREEVAHLRKRLAEASITNPAEKQQLHVQLAQNLAILGRMEEAIVELTRLTEKNPKAPLALNLLATMWEHQERWEESLRYYEKARNVWLQQPASPEQQSELVQAWKGIAYTQRKRGHYREAEAAYEKVLELAPTAGHHFLMAQFYEDAQQGDQAQFHADKAAELNPLSYRERADQLVDGLLGEQFGCWSIFRNRHH